MSIRRPISHHMVIQNICIIQGMNWLIILHYLFDIIEVAITKDNPAFSMINDSDEDVIYGSDEESRRPLNRSHNDDDSD